jgi:hypothetical protein
MVRMRLLVTGVALGTCTVAFAQDYFDFGQIPGVPDEPAVQVDINPMLLGLASAASRAENPAAADLLSSIDGVRVRIYNSLEDVDDVVGFVDDASARLESADWQRVVSVNDAGRVRIYIRGDEETVTGVTAMIVNDGDAVFVNIVGSISSQKLAESLANLDAGEVLGSLGTTDFSGLSGISGASFSNNE